MKKAFRIFSFLTITILYTIVIGLYSNNAFIHNTAFPSSPSENKYQSSLTATNLLCHTAQEESSIQVFNTIPANFLKNTFKEFTGYVKTIEQLFLHTFLQYSSYSKNILVCFKQVNIIFPFHYFW